MIFREKHLSESAAPTQEKSTECLTASPDLVSDTNHTTTSAMATSQSEKLSKGLSILLDGSHATATNEKASENIESETQKDMNNDNEDVDQEFGLQHIRQLEDENFDVITFTNTEEPSTEETVEVEVFNDSINHETLETGSVHVHDRRTRNL